MDDRSTQIKESSARSKIKKRSQPARKKTQYIQFKKESNDKSPQVVSSPSTPISPQTDHPSTTFASISINSPNTSITSPSTTLSSQFTFPPPSQSIDHTLKPQPHRLESTPYQQIEDHSSKSIDNQSKSIDIPSIDLPLPPPRPRRQTKKMEELRRKASLHHIHHK